MPYVEKCTGPIRANIDDACMIGPALQFPYIQIFNLKWYFRYFLQFVRTSCSRCFDVDDMHENTINLWHNVCRINKKKDTSIHNPIILTRVKHYQPILGSFGVCDQACILILFLTVIFISNVRST